MFSTIPCQIQVTRYKLSIKYACTNTNFTRKDHYEVLTESLLFLSFHNFNLSGQDMMDLNSIDYHVKNEISTSSCG